MRETLAGLGPDPFLLVSPSRSQVDAEPLHVPFKSNRKAALGGLALAAAVALAAWWTVREPNEPLVIPDPPVIKAAEAPPEITEPRPLQTAALPSAPDDDALEEEPTTNPEPTEPPPEPEASAEASPKAPKPTVRRARPKPKPAHPPTPPQPEGSQYRKPPDLVTEW
jgi:hypothetical protein